MHKSPIGRALELAYNSGTLTAIHRAQRNRLTVLAYHRIDDPKAPEFCTFAPNVSATPQAFAEQMDLLCTLFNVVSMQQVVAWLEGHSQLPPYAALITFDDGYRDNFDNAFPVLRARNLPATIFLATDCIGSSKPFYWDLAAHCFKNTKLHVAELPVLGTSRWLNDDERQDVALRWVSTVKSLPDSEKQQAAARLPETLDVTLSDRSFADLHLTWEQVCKMQAVGFEMGAHTCSHPILARIPLSEARRQISESRTAIEENTQQPVVTFAYPNGLSSDFTQAHQTLLAEFGFRAGFTLVPGPMSFSRALQQPMAIRRIFIGWRDDLPRFLAKLTGLARLADRLFAGK